VTTALWLIWEVAHLVGLPVAVGYWWGHRAGRKDEQRKHADSDTRVSQ
jgi:hypothetical protein